MSGHHQRPGLGAILILAGVLALSTYLPLGSSLSAQMDAKYEYNGNALESVFENDVLGPRYSFQGAFHLSHRDPGSFLLGGLGGVGTASFGEAHYDVLFAGGEAQAYMDNITLYA